jgi:hypothetical protein
VDDFTVIFDKSDVTKISFIYKNKEGDDIRSEYML